jgi:hypothetical protein
MTAMRAVGIAGRRVEIRVPDGAGPYIWHEGVDAIVSETGVHVAMEVEGIVYDPVCPGGVSRGDWERQFVSTAGGFERFQVWEEEF